MNARSTNVWALIAVLGIASPALANTVTIDVLGTFPNVPAGTTVRGTPVSSGDSFDFRLFFDPSNTSLLGNASSFLDVVDGGAVLFLNGNTSTPIISGNQTAEISVFFNNDHDLMLLNRLANNPDYLFANLTFKPGTFSVPTVPFADEMTALENYSTQGISGEFNVMPDPFLNSTPFLVGTVASVSVTTPSVVPLPPALWGGLLCFGMWLGVNWSRSAWRRRQ